MNHSHRASCLRSICVLFLFILVHFVRDFGVSAFDESANAPTRTEASADGRQRQNCIFHEIRYKPGDSWIHDEECAQCTCAEHGLSQCRPINCELTDVDVDANFSTSPQAPREGCRLVTRASFQNSSCCPVCADCVGHGHDHDGHGHGRGYVWEEDECTTCWCVEGQKRCHSQTCRVSCVHPELVPGKCCPKCPDTNGTHDKNSTSIATDPENDNGGLNIQWSTLILISLVCLTIAAAVLCILRLFTRNYWTRVRMRQCPEGFAGLKIYMHTETSANS